MYVSFLVKDTSPKDARAFQVKSMRILMATLSKKTILFHMSLLKQTREENHQLQVQSSVINIPVRTLEEVDETQCNVQSRRRTKAWLDLIIKRNTVCIKTAK